MAIPPITGRAAHRQGRWQVILAFLFPVVWCAWLQFAEPRPLHACDSDLEQGYIYGALCMADGLPVRGTDHPGTPAFAMGAAVLRSFDATPPQVDGPVSALRFMSALIVGLAFGLLVFRFGTPALAGVLTCSAWPGLFGLLDFYGADPLASAVWLLALTCLWFHLHSARLPSAIWFVALSGVVLATKASFLVPMAAAWGCFALFQLLRFRPVGGFLRLAGWGLLAGAIYLASVGPLIRSLPRTFLAIFFTRGEVRTALWNPAGWAELAGRAWDLSPAAVLYFGFWVPLLLGVWLWTSRCRPAGDRDDRASHWATFVFVIGGVGALLAGLQLTLSQFRTYEVPSVVFRHSFGGACFLPFLIALVFRRGTLPWRPVLFRVTLVTAALASLGTLLGELQQRRAWIAAVHAQEDELAGYLRKAVAPGAPVAVWDERAWLGAGPAAFHYWGNARYAGRRYGPQLAAAFAPWYGFNMRELFHDLRGAQPWELVPGAPANWPAQLHRFWPWFAIERNPYRWDPFKPWITGLPQGTRPGALIASRSEYEGESAGVSPERLLAALAAEYGGPAPELRFEQIGQREFAVILFPPTALESMPGGP
jgi:hypothetical protein